MEQRDATLRQLTGYCMRRATSQALITVTEALAPFGLRRTTFSALTVIADGPGLNQSQLAHALDIERPNLVQIVDELEAAGFVVRERAPQDGRAYALRATEAGHRVQGQALDALRRSDAALTEGLTPEEMAALHRALHLIETNAREALRDDPVSPPQCDP